MTHHVTYQFDDHVIDHVTDHDTLQNIKIKQRFENFGFLESFEKFPKNEFRNPLEFRTRTNSIISLILICYH